MECIYFANIEPILPILSPRLQVDENYFADFRLTLNRIFSGQSEQNLGERGDPDGQPGNIKISPPPPFS